MTTNEINIAIWLAGAAVSFFMEIKVQRLRREKKLPSVGRGRYLFIVMWSFASWAGVLINCIEITLLETYL